MAEEAKMNFREDEIAYLGTERCYCGHLKALHNFHCCEFCHVEESPHHFCSEEEERQHYALQERERGNPAVGRRYGCPECEKRRAQ